MLKMPHYGADAETNLILVTLKAEKHQLAESACALI